MLTNEEFYRTLPDKIRAEKITTNDSADVKQKKQKIDFEMIIDPIANSQNMRVKMRKLKFFMRPQVFHEISEFAISCLKKLDLKTEKEGQQAKEDDEEDDDPMNDSFTNPVKGTADDKGMTVIMDIQLLESIFVLERREF